MIENGQYGTVIETADGTLYRLMWAGPPKHPDCKIACPACLVVNAWTQWMGPANEYRRAFDRRLGRVLKGEL